MVLHYEVAKGGDGNAGLSEGEVTWLPFAQLHSQILFKLAQLRRQCGLSDTARRRLTEVPGLHQGRGSADL